MVIGEQIELINKFRNDLFYYLTSGSNAVYLGSNPCSAIDGPYKGIQMLSCVAFDPEFRELSKKF